MQLVSRLAALLPALALIAVQAGTALRLAAQIAHVSPAAQGAPNLLTALAGKKDPLAGTIKSIRSRPVQVDIGLLDRTRAGDVLRIELFKDQVFAARFGEREDLESGYVWTGTLVGLPLSSFIIAVHQDSIDASFLPQNGHPHPLTVQSAPGMHVVRELDRRNLRSSQILVSLAPGGPRESACNDNLDEVIILVVYDTLALSQARSTRAILAAAAARIAYLNTVAKNSKLNLRFKSVVKAVSYRTRDLLTDIYCLQRKRDNCLEVVHTWRDQYKADLVTMMVGVDRAKHGRVLGIGFRPSKPSGTHPQIGFSVSEWNTNETFSHEIFHNFGCGHDPANITQPAKLLYPWARGHKMGLWLFGFSTIMAYPDAGYPNQIPMLSGPNNKWGVWVAGAGANNNRQCVLNTRQRIANYRRTNTAPVFTQHPTTSTRCQGYQVSDIIMTCSATTAPRYGTSYKWYRNGLALAGQNSNRLRLRNITTSHAGVYHCVASNNCGGVASRKATLTVSSTCNMRRFRGATNSEFGFSVSRAGDFNRDGYEDFVIGQPRSGRLNSTGGVEVRSGKDSTILLSLSYQVNEQLGFSVAAAGDVDQDGYADIIVGAVRWGGGRGYARVISGKTRKQKYIFFGDTGAGAFGTSVSGAGDVDGDGHPDLIVGAPLMSMARLFSGRTGKVIRTLKGGTTERLGQAVGAAGDIDQDGYDDVIIGAVRWSGWRGYARVVSGRTGKTIHTVFGTDPNGLLGWAVTGIGDVDLDGFPDFAVGSPNAHVKGSLSGLVQVFSGRDKKRLHSISYSANEQLGHSVAAAGDVDGDGRPDFHVGAPRWGGDRGYARTLSGRTGGQIAISMASTLERRGHSVSGIEANGDGRPDLLVGSPRRNTVWLLDGPLAADPPEIEIYGAACKSSQGTLPHIAFGGRASIGKNFEPKVYAGTKGVTTWLMLDATRSALPLSIFGAPGCTAYALPTVALSTSTDANGRGGFKLPMPNRASLIGAEVHAQWLLFDTAANGGLVTSNAARIKMGRQ